MSEGDKMNEIVIKFDDVSKDYRLYPKPSARLKSYFFGTNRHSVKHANTHISFEIYKGETVAILGENGAGKSTLLKMVTGVVFPTNGKVTVNGRVSALLELTAGFDEAFTGRENIRIKGMLLGLSSKEISIVEPEIVAFADIGEYIDQPVRTYSSGMKARLGFAVNASINPDILIIDEALSVGDKRFQKKCKERIASLQNKEGVTTLLVTHSMESASTFCERGIVLEYGALSFDGEVSDAIGFYQRNVINKS